MSRYDRDVKKSSRYDDSYIEEPTPVKPVNGGTPTWGIGGPPDARKMYPCYLESNDRHSYHTGGAGLRAIPDVVNNMSDMLTFLIRNTIFRRGPNDEANTDKMDLSNTELLSEFINHLNTDRDQYVKEIKTLLETQKQAQTDECKLVKEELARINTILNSTTEHDWQKKNFDEILEKVKNTEDNSVKKEEIENGILSLDNRISDILKELQKTVTKDDLNLGVTNLEKHLSQIEKDLSKDQETKQRDTNEKFGKLDDRLAKLQDKLDKPQEPAILPEIERGFTDVNNRIIELKQQLTDKKVVTNEEMVAALDALSQQIKDLQTETSKQKPVEIDLRPILDRLPKTRERAEELFDSDDGDIFNAAKYSYKVFNTLKETVVPKIAEIGSKI